MKYYTESTSISLAVKLKVKGMPIEKEGNNTWCPSVAEVLDWLMSRDFEFFIDSDYQDRKKIGYSYFIWYSDSEPYYDDGFKTWHEAANAAIEKALTLI